MRSVNLGRWSRYVERYFNIKGGGGLMDVDQSIRAILPIQAGVEDRSPQGWNRFAVVAAVSAVAALFARARIRNPVGSNVVGVLEMLNLYSNGSPNDVPFVTWGATTTDLTNIVPTSFARMDPRGNPQPTMLVSQVSQAAGGLAFLQQITVPNQTYKFLDNVDQQIPLLPGQVVDVQSNVANNPMVVTFMWRERALEQSELT